MDHRISQSAAGLNPGTNLRETSVINLHQTNGGTFRFSFASAPGRFASVPARSEAGPSEERPTSAVINLYQTNGGTFDFSFASVASVPAGFASVPARFASVPAVPARPVPGLPEERPTRTVTTQANQSQVCLMISD